MKAKIALFGWTRYPDWPPHAAIVRDDGTIGHESSIYSQITEAVEVDFPELDAVAKLDGRIASLLSDQKSCQAARDKETEKLDERLVLISADLEKLTAERARLVPAESPSESPENAAEGERAEA